MENKYIFVQTLSNARPAKAAFMARIFLRLSKIPGEPHCRPTKDAISKIHEDDAGRSRR